MKAIYFDMDGTLANLYGVRDWLNKLHNEDVSPYVEAEPMYDMRELNSLLEKFIDLGFIIGVISWSAMGGSKEYNKATRKAKKEWIKNNLPCVSEFHVVKYGTPKHYVGKVKDSILVDDNKEVREKWNKGLTVNANYDIIEALTKILEVEKNVCKAA